MKTVSKLLCGLEKMSEATSYSPLVKRALYEIEEFCKKESGIPNTWSVGNRVFFFEWPIYGETEDGSVEGTVYEKVGNTSNTIGSYYISEEGKIIEFPFLPKDAIREDD